MAELGPAEVGRALTADKSLLGVCCVRGAPCVVPTADAAVNTAASLPVDQGSFGVFLGGWAASLEAAGLSVSELLDGMARAAMQALDGQPLLIDELRTQIARRVPALTGLSRPSGAHADLPEPLLRALGLLGLVCIAAEPGSDPRLARTDAKVARTDRWLGRPPPGGDRPRARPAGPPVPALLRADNATCLRRVDHAQRRRRARRVRVAGPGAGRGRCRRNAGLGPGG